MEWGKGYKITMLRLMRGPGRNRGIWGSSGHYVFSPYLLPVTLIFPRPLP